VDLMLLALTQEIGRRLDGKVVGCARRARVVPVREGATWGREAQGRLERFGA
jgi:hypothetical protein